MTRFPVDDVTPAPAPLPTRPLRERFPDALALGGDPDLPVLADDGVHPLFGAVARAFAEHRPLVLSPDAVWLTIAGGVAQHVRLHAEELRPRLVAHAGKQRLTVTVGGEVPWPFVVESFAKQVGWFECDFSTSTDVERVAGQVVLLDVYSPYYTLWLTILCGIPSVTLTGTVEDWRRIRSRVDALEPFGLQTWRRSLAPILDEFVRAASGAPDPAFWQRIYNPADAYGGDRATGWIARFYPYLKSTAIDVPNPLLDLPLGEPREQPDPPGVQSSQVPAAVSRVVVNVNDQVSGVNRVVALHGGLVAVAQDEDGALRPVAGWHVTPATLELHDVLDRVVRDHDTTPPLEPPHGQLPEEVIALYHRMGSASLFGGRWRLIPVSERRFVHTTLPDLWTETLFELADGRTIVDAYDMETHTTRWLLCRVAPDGPYLRLADDPADVPVLGTSLAMLLDAALDADGDVAHLETGRLSSG
ncbi:DUF4419 domain-containing protein [Dactylosporangium sp. NPDC005572]|uniref:DUF4419 domain-containing protein n=1 Tax=Dactylosporangium sp. NPDC005572 TaxID=3156889 RepID=UPI0033BA383C